MSISVIIPCYNCENTIEFCISSVFKQTYPVNEIICINDGSTDSSIDKLFSLKGKSPSYIDFIILEQKNSGPASARNNAIKIAKGDWIAFLDSDDFWDKNKIKNDVDFISKNVSAKIFSSSNIDKEFKEITFSKLLYKNYFQTSSVVVYRECMIENLFNENQQYSEDYRAWLDIVYKYRGFIISPKTSFAINSNKELLGFFHGNGLSSKIWNMELGELSNYKHLYINNKISFIKLTITSMFSIIRFTRRLFSKYL